MVPMCRNGSACKITVYNANEKVQELFFVFVTAAIIPLGIVLSVLFSPFLALLSPFLDLLSPFLLSSSHHRRSHLNLISRLCNC